MQYFYTFDYMLDLSTDWRDELWDHYQNAPEGSAAKVWYYKCWQDFNNAVPGLQRLIEAVGTCADISNAPGTDTSTAEGFSNK